VKGTFIELREIQTMSEEIQFQKHLYDVAFEMYRYIHTDVWNGQKYYTTLNTAISSIGFTFIAALLQLSSTPSSTPKNAFLVAIPIFIIGCVVALFAYYSIRVLRENFLQAVWFKTVIEESLKDDLEKVQSKVPNLKQQGNCSKKWRLTPVYSLPDNDHHDILFCTEMWTKSHISNKGGITWYFMGFQIVFFIINILGITTATILWLL
jgi:hypothetical protein